MKFKLTLTLLWGVLFFTSCSSDNKLNSDNNIDKFAIDQYIGQIDHNEGVITITVPMHTKLQEATPYIMLPSGASSNPRSGELVDLLDPKEYVVTAENGDTKKYTVIANNLTFWTNTTDYEIKENITLYSSQFEQGDKAVIITNTESGKKFTLDLTRNDQGTIEAYISEQVEVGEYTLILQTNGKSETYLETIKISKSTAPVLYDLDQYIHEYKGADFVVKGENLRKENELTAIYYYRKGSYEFPHMYGEAKFDEEGNIIVKNSKMDLDRTEYAIQVQVGGYLGGLGGKKSNRIFFRIIGETPVKD